MPIERRIDQPGTATADAAGVATLTFNGPARGYLEIDTIALDVSPRSPIPEARCYSGPSAVTGMVLATIRGGDAGTFRGTGDRLNAGQQITVQWTGCAAGATCHALLRGRTVEP